CRSLAGLWPAPAAAQPGPCRRHCSTFPWTYDEQETCLLLEGDVSVTPDGGEPVRFGAGDLVVFDAGLHCTWDVHAPVRKHYRFG
ncbi:MAG: cupin domain-containing protein, partial [Cyanobium sp.]